MAKRQTNKIASHHAAILARPEAVVCRRGLDRQHGRKDGRLCVLLCKVRYAVR
jgi:hypothetical protein